MAFTFLPILFFVCPATVVSLNIGLGPSSAGASGTNSNKSSRQNFTKDDFPVQPQTANDALVEMPLAHGAVGGAASSSDSATFQRRLDETQQQLDKANSQLEDDAKQLTVDADAQVRLSARVQTMKDVSKQLIDENMRLKDSLKQATTDLGASKQQAEGALRSAAGANDEWNAKMASVEQELQAAKQFAGDTSARFDTERQQLNNAIVALQAENARGRTAVESLAAEKAREDHQVGVLQTQLEQLQRSIVNISAENQRLEMEVKAKYQTEISNDVQTKITVARVTGENQRLEAEKESLEKQLQNATETVSRQQVEVQLMEERVKELYRENRHGESLQSLSEEKNHLQADTERFETKLENITVAGGRQLGELQRMLDNVRQMSKDTTQHADSEPESPGEKQRTEPGQNGTTLDDFQRALDSGEFQSLFGE